MKHLRGRAFIETVIDGAPICGRFKRASEAFWSQASSGGRCFIMNNLLPLPSVERVKAASEKFDQKYKVIEEALGELFGNYPLNTNPSHVLLKVAALNRLYSAGVLAVGVLADHIYRNGKEIDLALAAGNLSAVERIERVTIQGKEFNFFSFATKYCNWHRPDLYPVYDSRVDQYLWSLQKHSRFSDFNHRPDIRKDYIGFFKIMTDLRSFYKLESTTFKEIDKFLWTRDEVDSITGKGLQHYLNMIPDVPPDPGDELPEGWSA
jgi:hypothetical protein